MNSTVFTQSPSPTEPLSPDTSAQPVSDSSAALRRLDDCAIRLEQNRESLGDVLYADMVSQAYVYASFLADCQEYGMKLTDPRIREAVQEMQSFCAFIENEMGY